MQIKEFINHICEQIRYKPIRKEISEELENHLIEAKENYVLEGMQEMEAEKEAIKQMGNAEEIGKRLNKIHCPKLDWKLLLVTLILIVFGGLVTFTRAVNYSHPSNEQVYYVPMIGYMFTLFIGIILSIFIYFLDYRKLLKNSEYLYGLATLLIIFVMMFGYQVNGSKTYISILGNMIYTPSIAVPLYILAFIGLIQKIDQNKNLKIACLQKEININIDILKIIILSGISLVLLGMVPATVLMLVLGMIYLLIATVKLLECKKKRKVYIAVLWGIPLVLGIVLMIFVLPMALNRLIASFAPEQDPAGRGWLGVNQKMILESANWLGEADDMSHAITLFDEGTNFAFISILAHYGWMVSLGMVIAIMVFSIKLMINAVKIKDTQGKLVIVGMAGLFILQSIFNLLMNFNLGIKSNVNIPFISYGRQDLIINMMSLALVLSVYRRKDILVSDNRQNISIKNATL